jgi:hypothetical protein
MVCIKTFLLCIHAVESTWTPIREKTMHVKKPFVEGLLLMDTALLAVFQIVADKIRDSWLRW